MKIKRNIALLTMAMAAVLSITSYAGWYQNGAGTWYYCDDATGQNLTDFQYIDGKWYFFCTNEDATKGAMLTGEQWIVGMCFYLDPNDGGAVAFNADHNGMHFGPNGYAIGNNTIPAGMRIKNRTMLELYGYLGFGSTYDHAINHVTENVVHKIAGKDIPYPAE